MGADMDITMGSSEGSDGASSTASLPMTTFDANANANNNNNNSNGGNRWNVSRSKELASSATKRHKAMVVLLLVAIASAFAAGGFTIYILTKDGSSPSSGGGIRNSNNNKDESDPAPAPIPAPVPRPPVAAPASTPIDAPGSVPVSPPVDDEEGLPLLVSLGSSVPVDEVTGLPIPHDVCHGDCDTDSDCAGHLVCFQRSANEVVPGCAGGRQESTTTDYCVYPEVSSFGGSPPHLEDGSSSKLDVCQGDCDEDWDCAGHLVCFQREANEAVLGCLGGETEGTSTDYCVVPALVDYGRNAPRSRFPLQACEGRCTADIDCGAGLVCRSHAPGTRVEGCSGRVALPDPDADADAEPVVTDFCVPGSKAPTAAPFALSTSPPGSDDTTYEPGKLTVLKNQLMLSQGLDARLLGESGLPVQFANGSPSSRPFHARPDAAATFADPSGSGGFAYLSNSEHPDDGKGGVGAIYFDKDGNIVDYKMVLTKTRMNCGGGRSPWGTWVSNEEHGRGRIWQVDPYGTVSKGRPSEPAVIGDHRGAWESFAFDNRNSTQPRFFATEDAPSGALVRHTPRSDKVDWSDPWNILHLEGAVEYLVLVQDANETESGTYYWTTNRNEAKASAKAIYPQTEGIDVRNGVMYFVCKRIKMMFTLDLDDGTWTRQSTKNGLFSGGPDQLQRIVGDDRDMLYFTEERGRGSAIHARDTLGRFYVIVSSDELPGETTGLAFSPDGRFLFVAYQDTGKLFMVWRRDGKPFHAERLDVKFHHVPATADV